MFFDKFFRQHHPEEAKKQEPVFSFKAGQPVEMVKISKSGKSDIEVGSRVTGNLSLSLEVGRPISIKNVIITSPVKEIRQENGRYFAVTNTSLYELFPIGAVPKEPEAQNAAGVQKPQVPQETPKAPLPTEQKLPNKQEHVEQIPSSELRKGQEITLTKLSKQADSNIETGFSRRGRLMGDIAVGTEIVMQGFMTSRVKEIRESNGRYYAVTNTSLYEITPHQLPSGQEQSTDKAPENTGDLGKINPAELSPEKPPSLEAVIVQIESTLATQPESVRENWESIKKHLYKVENVQGKLYAFSVISSGDYKSMSMALVRGENPTDPWKMRVFRYSDSDQQWKSLPAVRWDGSYSKGDEGNPLHHYVQSAKLHKDIYRALEGLPVQKQMMRFKDLVPYDTSGNDGRYENELEFKETYQTLKNQEWSDYQSFNQWALKAYHYFLPLSTRARQNFSRSGDLYKTLSQMDAVAPLREFREKFDMLLDSKALGEEPERMIFEKTPKEFREAYDSFVGKFLTKLVERKPPDSMIPDFLPANRKDTYYKTDPRSRAENTIRVEEYDVHSPEGDLLRFAMAKDQFGRLSIDNVYDPRSGMTDYGTLDNITQMGLLVYKVEDYTEQAGLGFPKESLKPSKTNPNIYQDISGLWEKNPIIARYKEELKRRGEL